MLAARLCSRDRGSTKQTIAAIPIKKVPMRISQPPAAIQAPPKKIPVVPRQRPRAVLKQLHEGRAWRWQHAQHVKRVAPKPLIYSSGFRFAVSVVVSLISAAGSRSRTACRHCHDLKTTRKRPIFNLKTQTRLKNSIAFLWEDSRSCHGDRILRAQKITTGISACGDHWKKTKK